MVMTNYKTKIKELGAETHCCKFIKPGKKFIQQLYKFLCTAGRGQLGEAHDVCKQDAATEAVRLSVS